ncbi:MAG: hypothetical protein ABJI69_09105 [Balneola sp.]
MKPIEFEQQNTTYAEDQVQYHNLPSHVDKDGVVTSCWEVTEEDLQEIQSNGKIYISILTFGGPLQPISVSIKNPLIQSEVHHGE